MTTKGARSTRVGKALLNAKVNFIFYFLTLVANFIARKVFLDQLGAEFIGLTGTLLNILGYLNLAEFGVSSAISFNLYKPIKDGDRKKIGEIVSLLGYYYRRIGTAVGAAGVALSIFLYFIFKDSAFTEFGVIYFAYYTFLISALLGYFINYRQLLLVADQRNYVVASLYQSCNILKAMVQIAVALYFHNFYAWIAIELVFSVGYCVVLNRKIDKIYPWLKPDLKEGKVLHKRYPDIFKSTKQVFIHKFKDFLLVQSDQLFVFIFVSLKMVAYYGNYVLITSKAMQLFSTLLDGVVAGIGNLIAENDKVRIMKVFWELMAVRYFLAGFVCFLVYQLISPFVILWFGQEYLLSQVVVLLLVVNLFILISRGTVDNFNFAYGLYADVWAAWVELILNVGITIVAGYFWGVPGILLGKTASMMPIVIFWKPLYLFRAGFRISYAKYWGGTVRYYFCLGVSSIFTLLIVRVFPSAPEAGWGWLALYAVVNASVFGIFYAISLILLAPGGKTLLKRLKRYEN